MCYLVYISTDSSEELSRRNSELVRFEPVNESNSDPCTALLAFPNRWQVRSKSGCSCTFRHLASPDLGFSDPEEWYPEERDELEATRELYSTLIDIVSAGYSLDLVDRWEGARPEDISVLDVSLDEVSSTAFRMFENHRFRFRRTASSA